MVAFSGAREESNARSDGDDSTIHDHTEHSRSVEKTVRNLISEETRPINAIVVTTGTPIYYITRGSLECSNRLTSRFREKLRISLCSFGAFPLQ